MAFALPEADGPKEVSPAATALRSQHTPASVCAPDQWGKTGTAPQGAGQRGWRTSHSKLGDLGYVTGGPCSGLSSLRKWASDAHLTPSTEVRCQVGGQSSLTRSTSKSYYHTSLSQQWGVGASQTLPRPTFLPIPQHSRRIRDPTPGGINMQDPFVKWNKNVF